MKFPIDGFDKPRQWRFSMCLNAINEAGGMRAVKTGVQKHPVHLGEYIAHVKVSDYRCIFTADEIADIASVVRRTPSATKEIRMFTDILKGLADGARDRELSAATMH